MFDQLKGMAGLAGLMKDLPRIKSRMEEIKQSLAAKTVEAETGGGAVRAEVTCAMRVESIHIEPSLMHVLVDPSKEDDKAMAEDLIVGAVNAAMQKAREVAEQEIAQAAGELGVPLPPGGLSGFMT